MVASVFCRGLFWRLLSAALPPAPERLSGPILGAVRVSHLRTDRVCWASARTASSVFVLLLNFAGIHLQVTSSRYVWKFNVCALAFLKMFRVPAIGCRTWGQLPPWAVGPLPRGTLYHLLLKNEQGVAGVGPLCPCLGSPGFLLGRHEARRKPSCLGKGGGDSEGRPYLDCQQSRHGDLGAAWAYSSPCTAPLLTLGFGLSSLLPTHILTRQR